MKIKWILALLAVCTVNSAYSQATLDTKLDEVLQKFYGTYKDVEYFSGATLSVSVPNEATHNFYAGFISRDKKSKKINADTLFQIGSITKSFTAAIILQLEKEEKLTLEAKLKNYLPKYAKWGDVTIKSLLNMSSGLPNYSDTPLFNVEEYQNLSRVWTDSQLINYVYPQDGLNPPLKSGYFYSNTGYLLISMLIEQLTKGTFQHEINARLIKPLNLTNTFYLVPTADAQAEERLASGYNYNQYDNPNLVGEDVHDNNLSWAGAAGAIISNSEDITKWIRALFTDDKFLNQTQRTKLKSLVSIASGKEISQLNSQDSEGFGLGVAQMYDKDIGAFWFYEGQTLGYRAFYMYTPCNDVIISGILNSATNAENDHSKKLITQAYRVLLANNSNLNCKKNKKIS